MTLLIKPCYLYVDRDDMFLWAKFLRIKFYWQVSHLLPSPYAWDDWQATEMKSSNSSESRRHLDFVPSFRPSFLSVVLVFVCGCLWVKNETTNERLIGLESRINFSPAFRVSRLNILTGCLFHQQKLEQEIFIRRFRHMYQKGSVILQVKSSIQMFFRCR